MCNYREESTSRAQQVRVRVPEHRSETSSSDKFAIGELTVHEVRGHNQWVEHLKKRLRWEPLLQFIDRLKEPEDGK